MIAPHTQHPGLRCAQRAVSVASVLFASLALSACGDDNTTVLPDTNIPVAATANVAAIATGQKVDVNAVGSGPGGPLTFSWSAPAGRFTNPRSAATSWTAPDEPGTYSLAVVVSDGVRAGLGNVNIEVSRYVPADKPAYVGAVICSGCHAQDGAPGGNQFGPWSTSPHGRAIESLARIGQDQNGFCVGCHTVGTYGLNADVSLNNGGYDETAVARLHGVQCENCHGPGSEHPAPEFGSVQVAMDSMICGQCHDGPHHPTFSEWQGSGHASIVATAAGRAACAKCHNGLEAPRYLDDPLNYVAPASDPPASEPHHCAVCHDPHGNDNPADLRMASVTDVVLPSAILVESAGAGRLCMSCHNGRRTDVNINDMVANGNRNFGPHHSVQGDMLAGVNAFEDVAPDFAFASSRHILIQDACVTCHTHPNPGDPELGTTASTGHSFLPTVQACQPCHGELSAFTDVMAKADFDGDGIVEGVQEEVQGLLDKLQLAILDASTSPEARAAFERNFIGALGDAMISTRAQRAAGYNWAYVEFDGSKGIHNATYSIQLLQQSIESLATN